MAQADLVEALEDTLYGLRERLGQHVFPKSALDYLNDWAANDKSWLRKFYPDGSDEAHFDLTPSTERALAWLTSLSDRSFVGTESRLLTLFQLLKQMSEGTETNPQIRIEQLHKKRDEIDAEVARVLSGDMGLLDDAALKDRFQQFSGLARDLLSDFREVEHNFRGLDRRVRERIALWDGAKGQLLHEIMGERDVISDSDQGRSFRAFWDFLMSQSRQEEFSHMLERVLALPPVSQLAPDRRLRRVHYDWLEAGEYAQRTVAQLSQQLRRFLDDKVWLENRRIMDLLHGIEAKAMTLRDAPVPVPRVEEFMQLAAVHPVVELPMERPLYGAAVKTPLASVVLEAGDEDLDATVLFSQVRIEKSVLAEHIRQTLQTRDQVTLGELLQERPLQQGLGELVAYLQLASESLHAVMDESTMEVVEWKTQDDANPAEVVSITRRARLPRVIFVRN